MNNAVEKWERLGVTPPRNELHVSAVGLSAARVAPPPASSLPDAATLNMASADELIEEAVEVFPEIATEITGVSSEKKYRVEAAHAGAPGQSSQLSQRMQRVQETCARLLPIKGRSLPTSVGSQANWMMRVLFHPEAVVVLLLIVACFLAIVIFDDREEGGVDIAANEAPAVLEGAEAPAFEPPVAQAAPATPAPTQPAPAVPAPPVAAQVAATPPAAAPPTPEPQAPANPAPVAPAQTPIAQQPPQPQTPAVPAQQPVSPGADVPYVAQAVPAVQPPAAAPQAPVGASPSPMSVTEVTTPPVQNTTIQRPLGPHANSHNGAQQQLPWSGMYPQAATNLPAVIDGPLPTQTPQASVWPQTATPMFEAPPSGPAAGNTASARPQPQRIINPTYTPLPATMNRPPAANMATAYPTTVAPQLNWTPQHVAQRPPEPTSGTGAAQLRGTIEQPQSGTLHEHY